MSLLMAGNHTTLFTDCHVSGYPGADAILCENGTIAAIGTATAFSADDTVSLKGGYLYPGFTDAHLHLVGLGWSMEVLNLVETKSEEEIVALVSEEAAQTGKQHWIQGRGWDQNDWPVPEYPTRRLLDRAVPDIPVLLRRIDGHAAWVNSRALEIAGITADSADPVGGKILRDENGDPTGILIDNAVDLVAIHIPPDTREDKRRYILQATTLLNSLGITAVHDAGTDAETVAILKELTTNNALSLRVYAMLNNRPEDYQAFLEAGPETGNPFLIVQAIKLYLDGALGSRGAALLAPYSDNPLNYGLLLTDSSVVARQVRRFNEAGFQVGIHCIGDRANRIALNIFEKLRREVPGDHRNRIEHAQIIYPRDIPRFATLNVIPAMQATHCTSDMYWVDERLGPARLKEAYPWQSLVQAGSVIAGGSDAPVEYPDPLAGIYAAVTRQDQTGRPEGGWQPQERLTIRQAIRMYTEWPAYASFEENHRGKIAPGYFADFTVLSNNLSTINIRQILNTRVLFTVVNGTVVYEGK